jgi:hypothetical protein
MMGYSAQEIFSSWGDSIKHIFSLDFKSAVMAHPGNGLPGQDPPQISPWIYILGALLLVLLIVKE